jgi:toxin-antitoxin system PIN domain toxin
MNTLNFLDANLWLALLWQRHIHSKRANQWFEEAATEQFFFCRFTQITVLRLLTTAAIMGPDVRTMSQAWALWDRIWGDNRICFLAEPEALEDEFRLRSKMKSWSPKVWADAYLLAFAASAGLRLVTFDRALKTRGVDVLIL